MNGKIVLTLFISFIMITSIFGFIWGSNMDTEPVESLDYKGYEFKNINGKFLLELDEKEYIFESSPYDLGNIDLEDFDLESDKYYFLFDPKDKSLNWEYSMQKLYLTLSSLGIKIQLACSEVEGCDESLPIKTCKDYAFYFKQGNTKVYKENRCIVIQGNDKGISEAVDKIDLKLLGI